jgi:hypothetical protein
MNNKDEMKDIEKYEAFAARFQIALIARGWDVINRNDAGKLLGGFKGPAVSQWWHGTRMPPTEHAATICENMNISLDWLIMGRGSMELAIDERHCLDMSGLCDDDIATLKALVSRLKPHDYKCPRCAIDNQGRRKKVRRVFDRRDVEDNLLPDGITDRRKK